MFIKCRSASATAFEPVTARQTFPCFDEPNLKATFNISVFHDRNLHALSNEDSFESYEFIDNNGKPKTMTRFKKTVPMPVYLVSFVISDFAYNEDITLNGLRVIIIYYY